MASIYQSLGLTPILNANATLTKLGGSVMPEEVVDAMREAARHYIDLEDMQARVGARLALLTRNESARVVTGAAAGVALSVAACMTREDRARMARLPDTSGIPNEVLVFSSHRNGYDFSIRMTGARLIELDPAQSADPAALASAINAQTAAFVWFHGMRVEGELSLEQVIAVCAARGVPVLVDAAAQLPPVENLWKFTHIGATAAIFSGGKELRGPQASGMVLGARWLTEAMRFNGSPHGSFGRPMKVGKEEMAGLLAAVTRYLALDHEAKRARDERIVADWCGVWNNARGVCAARAFPNEAGQPLPRVRVTLGPELAMSGEALAQCLLEGVPAISVAVGGLHEIFVNPWLLSDDECLIVGERVRAVLTA